jgi:heat shock protein HtpX
MRAIKTLFLLTALTMLLVLGGDAIAGQQGMTFGLIIAVVMNGVAYFFSDKIALRSSGAQPVTREQLPRLYEVIERLVAKAQLPMPKLYVIPQPAPNAFATGRNPSHASVAVTAGLMELMNDDELEGVIAHELSHVRNYDILITSIAATLAGAITWIASMGRWAMIFGGYGNSRDNRNGGGLAALLMLFVAPIAALVIQLGISRQREFAADASGARMVGHPNGLVSALEKLGAYNKRIPMDVPPATASLFIVAPLSAGQVLSGLFSTHPPLSERIAVLRNMTITR